MLPRTAPTGPEAPRLIALDAIDEAAITRDRTGLDAEPLTELETSIAVSGLRQPIEVFPLPEPHGGKEWGLISGYRRVLAFRNLAERWDDDRYRAIPAFVRAPQNAAAAMAAMIEENEIRAAISPFERGRICVRACREGLFASIEEAVETLYPMASKQKRLRLRTLAFLAEEIDGCFTAPETLTVRQAERIFRAIGGGFGDLIRTALDESSVKDADHQWSLVESILAEAEENAKKPERADRPGRPRRILRPRHALTIRRERTRDGWSLHFTGREATGPLIDLVLDDIERMYAP